MIFEICVVYFKDNFIDIVNWKLKLIDTATEFINYNITIIACHHNQLHRLGIFLEASQVATELFGSSNVNISKSEYGIYPFIGDR